VSAFCAADFRDRAAVAMQSGVDLAISPRFGASSQA
jgi:hypothetical protein